MLSFKSGNIDYKDKDVIEFIKKYRAKYHTEPTDFSFRGYDCFFYFLNGLKELGPDFIPCITELKTEILQTLI